jgi:hypothetical protein
VPSPVESTRVHTRHAPAFVALALLALALALVPAGVATAAPSLAEAE